MTNLSPEICLRLKAARKAAKVGQTELALEVGCQQSAISMFERGQPTKLSEAVVQKIAKKFGVDLSSSESAVQSAVPRLANLASSKSAFCPNLQCPSNKPLVIDGRTLYLPDLSLADPVGGRFCALCGEILERRCPNCGSSVHPGAICSLCGEPYIAV